MKKNKIGSPNISSCIDCGEMFSRERASVKFCSRKCYYHYRSSVYIKEKHWRWKGGISNVSKVCEICKKTFVGHVNYKTCSLRCGGLKRAERGSLRGENNGMWRNGRTGGNGQYVYILTPEHPFATKAGYVSEHRLKMEKKIGRYLKETEVVHHINEIKSDNKIRNLQLMSKADHDRHHTLKRQQNKLLNQNELLKK